VLQEVTHSIAVLLSEHCFWKKYVASPWKVLDVGDPYFTMVLYRQSDITSAEGFRNNNFITSRMGKQPFYPPALMSQFSNSRSL
jgi:hypothetical protein